MAEFPDRFDSHLIVLPKDDPTHPFSDKAGRKKKARRVNGGRPRSI
jgi:hypothetical protein